MLDAATEALPTLQTPHGGDVRGYGVEYRPEASWTALAVADGSEQAIVKALKVAGHCALAPFETLYRRHKGRLGQYKMVTVTQPLIPGYVFVGVRGPSVSWRRAREANADLAKVRGQVMAAGRPARFSEEEIGRLRAMYRTGARSDLLRSLRKGDAVRVTSGPFRDFSSVIEAISETSVSVTVVLFGRNTAMEMSPEMVERDI